MALRVYGNHLSGNHFEDPRKEHASLLDLILHSDNILRELMPSFSIRDTPNCFIQKEPTLIGAGSIYIPDILLFYLPGKKALIIEVKTGAKGRREYFIQHDLERELSHAKSFIERYPNALSAFLFRQGFVRRDLERIKTAYRGIYKDGRGIQVYSPLFEKPEIARLLGVG